MISDRAIFDAAARFVRRFGNEAAIHAAMRADEFGAKNDLDGQRVWLRIIEAIKQLQRTRASDEAVN